MPGDTKQAINLPARPENSLSRAIDRAVKREASGKREVASVPSISGPQYKAHFTGGVS